MSYQLEFERLFLYVRDLYVWHYTTYPSVGAVKAEDDPEFKFEPNRIGFNSKEDNRITVAW